MTASFIRNAVFGCFVEFVGLFFSKPYLLRSTELYTEFLEEVKLGQSWYQIHYKMVVGHIGRVKLQTLQVVFTHMEF